MSKNDPSAYQGANPELGKVLAQVLDAMVEANPTDPRKVARQCDATIFHLMEGSAVTVRGLVEVNWPAEYWRPMCHAIAAGRYHTTPRRGGGTALVLEVQ